MRVSTKTGLQIAAGVIIGFALIYGFGFIADKTETTDQDTIKPLYYIVPVMSGILVLLISRYNK